MSNDDWKVNNYAAAFIDILGQRDELTDCSLITNKEQLLPIIKNTVGTINRLHTQFEEFYKGLTKPSNELNLPSNLPEQARKELEKLRATALKFQRFSDGLVPYITLAKDSEHLPINGIYGLISSAGSLCYIGLAQKSPLRAGIDIAWGVELNENELYGCVIAKAYDLESEKAQWPRVVLGQNVIDYLYAHANQQDSDLRAQYEVQLAKLCIDMIAQDIDGEYIVDYLGSSFKEYIASVVDDFLYRDALSFIDEQVLKWDTANNDGLRQRYEILKDYFIRNAANWSTSD